MPSADYSLKHYDAYVRWDGRCLVLGNAAIERRWAAIDGLPQALSLRHGEKEWLAGALPGPSSAAPGAQAAAEVHIHAHIAPLDILGADALVVSWEGAGLCWRWCILPGLAAIGCQLWRHRSAPIASVAQAEIAAAASGVEGADAQIQAETLLGGSAGEALPDRCERWALAPIHLRLVEASFQDRTDLHDELLQEREWLLHPNEARLALRGVLWSLEDSLDGRNLTLLKEAPLPAVRPLPCPHDLLISGSGACHPSPLAGLGLRFTLELCGHGVDGSARFADDDAIGDGYRWWVLAGRDSADRRAVLQSLQRALRAVDAQAWGRILSNTWGDRSRDGALNPQFMAAEITAASALGVEVVQIDDGWQRGISANSVQAGNGVGVWEGFHAADEAFWSEHPQRFPDGLAALVAQAQQQGMEFGLWFAPDSAEEFAHWQRDAAAVLELHQRLGVRWIKIDGVKARTRLAERRLHAFFARVAEHSRGQLRFDLDVTAEVRPGYWGLINVGPVFVENRYTDSHRWWPHHTWRNGWQLARWMDPQRLRLEFLNPERNAQLYGDDPLAPSTWPFATIVAMSLPFSPLAWCELQHLAAGDAAAAAQLIAIWKELRPRWQASIIHPVGPSPDGLNVSALVGVHDQGLIILALRGIGTRMTITLPLSQLGLSFPRSAAYCHHGHGHASIGNDELSISVTTCRAHALLEFLGVSR
ncbi:MAG: hypothetical protein EA402_05475 [Planctomycetota bacterium]|nr:MAG: hypothetical protein EA402_05475 [Planctomycetota bacterium]